MKKRLGEISTRNKTSTQLWKPTAGKQLVRIVPNKASPDNPFVELKFHYNLGTKNHLSPSTFNRPDPVVEMANKLRQTGDQDDYKLGSDMFPKMRIYAPVIVRGEEDKGVRFWGFGKQVYQQLLGLIADEDYGDISSMTDGNDISVEYLTKEDTGKSFPETHIRAKPKKTPAGDSSVAAAIKNQPLLEDIYPEPTYEELKSALEQYLNPEAGDEEVESLEETSEKASTTQKAAAPTKDASADVASDFDKLFNG